MEAETRTAKKAKSELSSRDLIMLATLRLIAQEGIDAVTHRRVAEIAGVSPGTTTHHFAGRKGLLRESFISYLSSGDTLFTMFYATAAQDGPMAVDSVREGLVRLVEREFADASLLRAEYELMLFASQDDELGKAVTAWEARAAGAVAAERHRRWLQCHALQQAAELARRSLHQRRVVSAAHRQRTALDALRRQRRRGRVDSCR